MPEFCVVMPMYNSAACIERAVQSVLSQTYRDFRLIVVDDGSIDASVELVQSFNDPRICILENGVNYGIEYSLNRGIAYSDCSWIVRLDSDDECLPYRLEKQANYLKSRPDTWVLGGWAELLCPDGGRFSVHMPVRNNWIKARLLFQNPFMHSAVAVKRDLFEFAKYSQKYPGAEDYDLWCKFALSPEVSFHNLSELLVRYRVSQYGISASGRQRQLNSTRKVREDFLKRCGLFLETGTFLYHAMADCTELCVNLLSENSRYLAGRGVFVKTAVEQENFYLQETVGFIKLIAALRQHLINIKYTSYETLYNELAPRFTRLARIMRGYSDACFELLVRSEFYRENI